MINNCGILHFYTNWCICSVSSIVTRSFASAMFPPIILDLRSSRVSSYRISGKNENVAKWNPKRVVSCMATPGLSCALRWIKHLKLSIVWNYCGFILLKAGLKNIKSNDKMKIKGWKLYRYIEIFKRKKIFKIILKFLKEDVI